ncbi:hypothetical protein B0T17DRAFT_614569 [Bombardia bombarda]|uniref:Uncharacterized protein n=1 Tax=Bombardia bombarda TaxID=252184 RepID=A0AA40C7R0_9PEZI|nr:hypothetical protein B0T17DRAFT_614569 [Bombardia bombarda]
MAPRTRTRAQRQRTSTTRQSVDTTADGAPSLPNCNSPDDDRRPRRFISKPDEVEHTQEEELEMVPQQPYAYVLGREMLVPQTYDPDTYDPDGPVPWTPEPEPYDPETYAAWGRKHFGEEWYKLRETMLRERNIYRVSDPVYLERQKALRVIEHKIEGRPFRPALRAGEMSNKDWKRLWSRLSKVLPRVQSPTPASSHADDSDGDTNLSGFSTYDPTPSPREPSPLPDDPWERLEYERKRFGWSEEYYQFERIFRKEERIDWARAKHEDQEGDRQREKELEEIEKVRYYPGTAMKSHEYYRRMRHFNLRAEGWTQEQIDAEDRAAAAATQKRRDEFGRQFNMPPRSQEEMNSKFDLWDHSGISREEQDRLGRMHGFYERPPNPYLLRAPKEKRPPPRNQEEMDQLFSSWNWILTRVEQNELARMYGFGPRQAGTDRHAEGGVVPQAQASPLRPAKDTPAHSSRATKNAPQRRSPRAARSRRSAPKPAEALPPNKPDASEELSDKTQVIPQGHRRQRRAYKKARASRRLAGEPPEFGLLSGRGETRSLYEASLQLSNTRKTSSPGARNGRLSKKPTAKGAKPQGILKSRQAGTGHSKRSARGSRTRG